MKRLFVSTETLWRVDELVLVILWLTVLGDGIWVLSWLIWSDQFTERLDLLQVPLNLVNLLTYTQWFVVIARRYTLRRSIRHRRSPRAAPRIADFFTYHPESINPKKRVDSCAKTKVDHAQN